MTQIEITSELTSDLIETWGSDRRVIEAARVSTQTEPKEGDEKLIAFLMKNKHASPFEHMGATFLIECPIFVVREWHRHRTQCLAADTKITCIQPDGTPYPRTIEHLYRTHHGSDAPERWAPNGIGKSGKPARTLIPGTDRYRKLNLNQKRLLRVFDEESREFTTGAVTDVYRSGIKEVFEVVTESFDGRPSIVKASAEHPFLTTDGWVKLKDLDRMSVLIRTGKIRTTEAGQHYPPRNHTRLGERHVRLDRLPKPVGEEMTYDIQMTGPNHNFMADRLVVHNSYNETSGRYSVLQPKFYAPDYDRPLSQKGKPGAYTFEVPEDDTVNIELYRDMRFSYQTAWNCYEDLLERGIAKEVARMVLPVGIYTKFYATANLRNWLNFLSLRTAPDAMYEIRMLAGQVETALHKEFPNILNNWDEYGRNSI